MADAIAKWVSRSPLPPFNVAPIHTPTIFCIGQSLCANTPRAAYKGLTPATEHNYVHPASFHWAEHSPLTSTVPLKWVNGLTMVPGFPRWYERQPRSCPLRSDDNPLDPLSFVAYCQSSLRESLRQCILCTWPSEVQLLLRPLLIAQPNINAPWSLRDRCNFIWSLLPTTYAHLLSVPPTDIYKAFQCHSKAMSMTAPFILKALHDSPLPYIPPPLPSTHAAFSAFFNLSTHSPLHNPPPAVQYTPVSSLPPPPAFKPTPAQAREIKKRKANTTPFVQPVPKAIRQLSTPLTLSTHHLFKAPRLPPSILPIPSVPPPPTTLTTATLCLVTHTLTPSPTAAHMTKQHQPPPLAQPAP